MGINDYINNKGEQINIPCRMCVCVCVCVCMYACSVVSYSLQPYGLPWNFPDKNSGGDCHFLVLGIFPTQGWNQCFLSLLIGRQILYH